MKRAVCVLLCLTFTNLCGCYYWSNSTKSEFLTDRKAKDIILQTNGDSTYIFAQDNYRFIDDYILGEGKVKNIYTGEEKTFRGKVYFSSVDSLKVEHLNEDITLVVVLASVAAFILLISKLQPISFSNVK